MTHDELVAEGLLEKTVEGQLRLTSRGEDYLDQIDADQEALLAWQWIRLTVRGNLLQQALGQGLNDETVMAIHAELKQPPPE